MRRIRIIEHISLDGVIQAPGGPGEDTDGGFAYGGWIVPHSDPAVGEAIFAAHERGGKRFDLLLGRRTYDIWSGYWPRQTGPIADSFNSATKYVTTRRPESLGWGPAQGLGAAGADVVEDLRHVKAKDGPDMIVWGSSTLTPVLLGHGMADEVVLLVYPVLLGMGKRFFADVSLPRELKLVSTKAAASGVVISVYRPTGHLRMGSFSERPA